MSDDLVSETTATFKFGGGYEAPWLVFRGTIANVKKQIIEAFELEDSEDLALADACLADLMLLAQPMLSAGYTAATGIGATPTRYGKKAKATPPAEPESPAEPEAPAKEEAKPEEPAQEATAALSAPGEAKGGRNAVAITEIASAPDKATLKQLWTKHNEAFKTDAAVRAAFEQRGGELNK